MTTDAASLSIPELEAHYKAEFPGFEPYVWACMAYHRKGYAQAETYRLLEERFGEENRRKDEEMLRKMQELKTAREEAEKEREQAERDGVEEVAPDMLMNTAAEC